jgi:hypothetical protein
LQNHSNLIPLDENNVYVGYYEMMTLWIFPSNYLLREQGNIIKVKKNTHDYSMSQIAQIVEVIMVKDLFTCLNLMVTL